MRGYFFSFLWVWREGERVDKFGVFVGWGGFRRVRICGY